MEENKPRLMELLEINVVSNPKKLVRLIYSALRALSKPKKSFIQLVNR